MKRYILVIFLKDTKPLIKSLGDILTNIDDDYRTSSVNVDQNCCIFTFRTDAGMFEIKSRIIDAYNYPPMFILFDGDIRGETFEMNFGQLEPFIMMEKIAIKAVTKQLHANNDENLTLNDLLELVFKNGYGSLTENQKLKLQKYSDEEEQSDEH